MSSPTKVGTHGVPFIVVVALIAAAGLIGYVDRGSLSVAAPALKLELGISASQLGLLLSAFFWSYTAMLFLSAVIIDRFEVNYVLAAGFSVWSIATALTGWAHGLAALFAARMLLGLGESVTFPGYSKILAQHLPEERRGFANGVILGAMKLGPAVGTLIIGLMMTRFGWRSVFIGIGLSSLVWLPAWLRWMPRGRHNEPGSVVPPGFAEILRRRSFWGTTLGLFCLLYVHYFSITWLPYYLAHEHGLATKEMALVASVYYLSDSAGAVTTGWATDSLIRRGHSAGLVRKTAFGLGLGFAAVSFLACSSAGRGYLPWLALAGFSFGCGNSGIYAFFQTLAGPRAVARWSSLSNGVANLAGVIGPIVTGYTVDRTGTFRIALAISAGMCVLSAVMWTVLVGEFKTDDWGGSESTFRAASNAA